MNYSDKDIYTIIKDLKENYCVSGIKAEFETETYSYNDLLYLKEPALRFNLDFTVKISGCGSIKDLYEAKELGVNNIVVPMIESQYSLQKFIETVFSVFNELDLKKINLFINIETITGCNNIKSILDNKYAKYINGIIIGRSDLASSLNLDSNSVDSQEILNISSKIIKEAVLYNKNIILGGGLSYKSIPFFKEISKIKLDGFETRKIIFDAKAALSQNNINEGINKAILFELMLLKNKTKTTISDINRIKILEERILQKEPFNA